MAAEVKADLRALAVGSAVLLGAGVVCIGGMVGRGVQAASQLAVTTASVHFKKRVACMWAVFCSPCCKQCQPSCKRSMISVLGPA